MLHEGVIKSDGYILACNPSTVWEEQYDGFTIKLEIPVAFFQVDGRYSRPKTSFPSLLKERNRNRVVEYSYPGIQMNFNSLDLGDNNEFRMFLLERPKSHDKNKRATVLLIHEDSVDSDGNKWYSRILDVGGVELDIANNPYLMKQPGWPWQLVFAGQNDYLKLGIAHNVSIGKPEVNFQVLNYKHVFAGRL
ncbi:hypothetical protein HK098_005523 [Nowakowskiella sp. JEL0407]|nr:hypothetical protein HK098_005523 [Nowakowskiella sp. JEL0407]